MNKFQMQSLCKHSLEGIEQMSQSGRLIEISIYHYVFDHLNIEGWKQNGSIKDGFHSQAVGVHPSI